MSLPAMGVDLGALQETLLAWLAERKPDARDLTISNLVPSAAGFSNLSLAFDLAWREGDEDRSAPLFFRGESTRAPVYPDPKLERQFRVMQSLHRAGVAVPQVHWMEEDEDVLGWPFYVMSRVDGAVPSEIPTYHMAGLCYEATPQQRARMWWSTVEEMATVHSLDWRDLGLDVLGAPSSPTGPLDSELDYWAAYLEWLGDEPQPILEASLDWLRANRYTPPRLSVCWGDARLPNVMYGPDGDLVALLDWDMAVLGDPEWDLAFMLTFDWLLTAGSGVPRLEGFPGTQETIERYEEITGRPVEHFAFSEVFAAFRIGLVILRVQKNMVLLGVTTSDALNLQDNFCTRRLADLLGLPQPGASATPADAKG